MDQEKIGKFIAELRKENGMTQIELAGKLGITDRAVSKWENGRGMPELSLIKPLCDELHITVNELLSGEKIENSEYTEYKEKIEENIINTLNYSSDKIRKSRKIAVVIVSVIVLSFVILSALFGIDVTRMRHNEPVLFSTWGFKYAPAIYFPEEEIKLTIKDYLTERNDSESKGYNNEKWFTSLRPYLIEEKSDNTYIIYAWVVEESFYLKDGNIEKDSGSSIPYKFTVVRNETNKFSVEEYQIPRDGDLYAKDMKSIFPKSVLKDMDDANIDGTVEKLQLENESQAKLYFHK